MGGNKDDKTMGDKKGVDRIKQENQKGERFNEGGGGGGGGAGGRVKQEHQQQQQQQRERGPRGHGRNFQRGHGGGRSGGGGHGGHGGHGGGGGQGHHNQNQQQNMMNMGMGMGGQDSGFMMPDSENKEEKKFTGRCRLFVGNLPNDCNEEDFKKLFESYGEFSEVYVNTQRGFGFIRMDTRQNAEAAKAALDGKSQKGGRMLRVRFATHGAAVRVKYLHPTVSNELLEGAFTQFGEIERAVIIVDDRGRSTGEGIVEFARKPGAQAALKRVMEGVFLMGSSPRPLQVEPLEQKDDNDGLPEKFVNRNQEFQKEREQSPRFCQPGSFEYEYGMKWKELYQRQRDEEELLKRQFEESVAKVEMEMANAFMEHQTAMLRQDLIRRQEELRMLEEQHQREIQRRMEMRRQEEERAQNEIDQRRRAMQLRQEEQRRQQELFVQQERAMREMSREPSGGAPPMQPPPAPPASMGLERSRQSGNHNSMGNMGNQGNQQMGGGGGQGLRQSRFDQPPGFQGGMGNAGDSGMGNMGGANMMNMGGMRNDRSMMMDRGSGGAGGRDRGNREDFYGDSKRPRRF